MLRFVSYVGFRLGGICCVTFRYVSLDLSGYGSLSSVKFCQLCRVKLSSGVLCCVSPVEAR